MTERKNNGGSAFPSWDASAMHRIGMAASQHLETTDERDRAYIAATADATQGLTKRDYFAAKAMHQLLAGAIFPVGYDATTDLSMTADLAYQAADAMLKARSK